jgi:hypothetical protein
VVTNPSLLEIKVPDATPEIVAAYALSDEQSLLAKVHPEIERLEQKVRFRIAPGLREEVLRTAASCRRAPTCK